MTPIEMAIADRVAGLPPVVAIAFPNLPGTYKTVP